MSDLRPSQPPILGLFQKRIEGDDCLLQLARLRFTQSGLGAEIYAGHPDELEHLLRFRPANSAPVVAHLSRDINLLDPDSRRKVREFARRFAGRILGMVVHDQRELVERPEDYLRGVEELNAQLEQLPNAPWLFVEYAVGLLPEDFARFAERIRELRRTSVCVDVGHVGIWQTRATFHEQYPGKDVCSLKPDHPELPALVEDVQRAVASALPTVLALIRRLGPLGKPVHFHLHDGHPASTFSPYGVSDHLSFLTEIPIPFEYEGRHALTPLFKPEGLAEIIRTAVASLGAEHCSFTLEIHNPEGRDPLDDASEMFRHWSDKTNAERMNHWLQVLRVNHELALAALDA